MDPAAGPAMVTLRMDGAEPLAAVHVRALEGLCDQAERTGRAAEVVVLDLTGANGHGWADGVTAALLSKWERALRRLETLDRLTVALLTGVCGGIAVEAMLAADYRIIGQGARLALPTHQGAVWPGMSPYRMANQIGVVRTRRAVLAAAPLDAQAALEAGLVDEVAQDTAAALTDAVRRLGGSCARPAARRRLVLKATTTSFEEALGDHLIECGALLHPQVMTAER
jgi:isomerase DpgB